MEELFFFFLNVMAMIFHKTKFNAQSLSHFECSESTRSKFGAPKVKGVGIIPGRNKIHSLLLEYVRAATERDCLPSATQEEFKVEVYEHTC